MGEIEALRVRYEAYRRAPDETRQRLYLEAMQEMLQSVKDKIVLDAELKQLLPLLDLSRDAATADGGAR
jgi:membrane protease subunit HflK